MKPGLLCFVALVSIPFSSLAQDIDCGKPADGLRMCIDLVRNATMLRVRIQNSGGRDQLVRIGSILGDRAYADRIRPIVSTFNLGEVEFTNREPGIVAGRLDPLVIPLAAGGSYDVSTPVKSFASTSPALKENSTLGAYLSVRSTLRVELRASSDKCPLYGSPNPNMIHCWNGALISNTMGLHTKDLSITNGDERIGGVIPLQWVEKLTASNHDVCCLHMGASDG